MLNVHLRAFAEIRTKEMVGDMKMHAVTRVTRKASSS